MQVDDDSCTDIDKTIELLDYFYNSDDCLMLTGSSSYFPVMPRYVDRTQKIETLFSHTIDPKLQEVLKKMEFDNLFVGTDNLNCFNSIPRLCHGWENNVLSKSAINRIKEYPRLEEYIQNCLEFKCKFGDEIPFLLARFAKVPICQSYFFSPLPDIEEYTAINKTGRFSHIHHVSEPLDLVKILEKIVANNLTFENYHEVVKHLEGNVLGTDWFFFHVKNKIISRCAIRLNEDQSISIIKEMPEESKININYEKYDLEKKKWEFLDKKIILQNEQNQSISFNKIKTNLYKADYENDFFILSKIHPVDRVYWKHKSLFESFIERIN
jgi:hypothetical protein